MSIFGQNNNQQQSSGFGGFGSGNNNNSGGFGQPSNTGSAFGGFGSGSTFGATNNNNNNSTFGQQNKTSFGTSSGGSGLFGSGTATASSGFGGFGSSNTNNAPTGGGLFGSAAKPAFGSGTTSGSGLFGGGSTNTAPASTPAFGGASTGAFGSPFGQNNTVCEGTGSTPFSAVVEKEGTGAATNHFQSISTMAPYKNFSFEELRLADYNQGRRYGNASGQAGAFGSTSFGGFGQQQNTTSTFGQQPNTSGGGLFNSGTSTSNPFSNNQSSGFGATNTAAGASGGGGLFGQKPGGLFGTSSPATTGGLFGTSTTNNTGSTTAFGSGTGNNAFGGSTTSGGGLFSSSNNQQQQSKPFSFGASNTTNAGGFGGASGGNTFGNNASNTTTAGGGLFGSNTQANSNPFGQQNNQQGSTAFGGGGFGQQNQAPGQAAPSNPFGGFGQQNQEQKPAGLFGNAASNTTTGGGLFGNQASTQSSGGLFGQPNNTQPAGSSLFGQKPAASGGLFGQNNTASTNTSGGLFGNQNQNTQTQGGGLFGTANNQQKTSGLFGNSGNTGGGLFGNAGATGTQGGGSSLFNLGGQNQQQQQQQQQPSTNSLFGNTNNNAGSSLFGNSQQQQQQPAQQNQFQSAQTLTTSIMDPNAFGSPSIFSGLPPPPQVSGPIATPITQKSKQKVKAVLPYYRLSPNHAAAYQTPTRRGYGFSYSTYGSPNSVSSIGSTPGGLGSSSLFGSVNRNLGKSMSLSNLRGSYTGGESLLSPSTFSSGSSRYGTAGSMKKLTIDRSLRTDLFGDRSSTTALSSLDRDRQPASLKKKVSFDASTIGGSNEQPQLAITNGSTDEDGVSPTPSAEEQGYIRSPRHSSKSKSNGISQADSEPSRGKELAIVPEDGSPDTGNTYQKRATRHSHEDQIPGAYWMKPNKEAVQKMSKEQRQQLANFSVGREGCGKVEFNKPVDISIYNLDDIFEKLVLIKVRSLTVYPDASRKPTLGKGMNVPSTIYLENSWPRGRDRRSPVFDTDGSKMHRHIDRLRKVNGVEFVEYQKDTGTWIFKVPHFTTYALNYDDDDASECESLHLSNSVLSEPPDTPTPVARTAKSTPRAPKEPLATNTRGTNSTPKASNRVALQDSATKLRLPGSFELQGEADDSHDVEMAEVGSAPPSPLVDGNLTSSPDSSEDESPDLDQIDKTVDSIALHVRDDNDDFDVEMAGSYPLQETEISKGNPVTAELNFSGDWTTDLLRSVRVPKRDRKVVRDEQLRTQEGESSSLDTNPTGTKKARQSMWTGLELLKSVYGTSPSEGGKNGLKGSRGEGGVKV